MAGELHISGQGTGLNLYAVLRRHSDSFAWDAGATDWEAWDDGSIDDYDIALTDRGGDLYNADFPTDVAAGTRVLVFYYKRAGASPAITDTLLYIHDVTWDGATTVAGGAVSIDSTALTTLASVKRHLNITDASEDTLLTELINMASAWIKRYCQRDFVATTYREWHNGNGRRLRLGHWPIIWVNRLACGADPALTVTYGGSDIRAVVQIYDAGVRLHSVAADGTATESLLDFATYPTASTLATAISLVTDWTAVLKTDVPAEDLSPLGGVDARDPRVVDLTYPDNDDQAYHVDATTGIVEYVEPSDRAMWDEPSGGQRSGRAVNAGFPSGFQNVLVEYKAGYETLPDDITRLANEFVVQAYHFGNRDPNLASESLGGYAYALFDRLQLDEMNRARLAPYAEIR